MPQQSYFLTLKFEMVYHPECTKRLIIGIVWSLRVTPIAYGLEAPKRHRKNTAYLSICFFLIQPSVVINIKDLLKTRLIFNFYAHISCKNDWNNVLLLNTNGLLNIGWSDGSENMNCIPPNTCTSHNVR